MVGNADATGPLSSIQHRNDETTVHRFVTCPTMATTLMDPPSRVREKGGTRDGKRIPTTEFGSFRRGWFYPSETDNHFGLFWKSERMREKDGST